MKDATATLAPWPPPFYAPLPDAALGRIARRLLAQQAVEAGKPPEGPLPAPPVDVAAELRREVLA